MHNKLKAHTWCILQAIPHFKQNSFLYKKLVFWYATIFIESQRDFSLNTELKNLRNARIFLQNSQIPILNQSVPFQLYKKECHLLSDKLESMEI